MGNVRSDIVKDNSTFIMRDMEAPIIDVDELRSLIRVRLSKQSFRWRKAFSVLVYP